MKYLLTFVLLVMGLPAWAQEAEELSRDPASQFAPNPKRSYPGGADEEDLRILSSLPDAPIHTDARAIQKDIYKEVFKQDLKDEDQDTVEE
ncbi:MAG: hypothetical protein AB7F86_19690 [Bdellovibrionales bacterium]